mmetsp:Transcript_46825/g.78023  ORF Transcript_46825/g.78023 Transcript_46825/m.78023 type:complete len:277 (+) Transcript_46825:381-1211(+)
MTTKGEGRCRRHARTRTRTRTRGTAGGVSVRELEVGTLVQQERASGVVWREGRRVCFGRRLLVLSFSWTTMPMRSMPTKTGTTVRAARRARRRKKGRHGGRSQRGMRRQGLSQKDGNGAGVDRGCCCGRCSPEELVSVGVGEKGTEGRIRRVDQREERVGEGEKSLQILPQVRSFQTSNFLSARIVLLSDRGGARQSGRRCSAAVAGASVAVVGRGKKEAECYGFGECRWSQTFQLDGACRWSRPPSHLVARGPWPSASVLCASTCLCTVSFLQDN